MQTTKPLTFAQSLLRRITFTLARGHYSVSSLGAANIPAQGGALLVCNHVTYIDTIILSMVSPRPIRFISYYEYLEKPVFGRILRLFGTIPVSSHRAKEAIVVAAQHVREGELVCIFPEGHLTTTGRLMELKSGFELIARRAKCPVIVAHLQGLWGSIFSFEGGRFFTKCPHGLRRRATVSFSPALSTPEATTAKVREILGEREAASSRPLLPLYSTSSHWPEGSCVS